MHSAGVTHAVPPISIAILPNDMQLRPFHCHSLFSLPVHIAIALDSLLSLCVASGYVILAEC